MSIKGWFITTIHDHTVNPVDVTAGGISLGAMFKYLPEISAGLSGIWVILRIIVLIRDEFWNKWKEKKDADK